MKYITSEEFYSALESNEYGRQYLELIEKVQSENRSPKKSGDGYERHHIHPRALSGSNEQSNLVKLTVFEHCLCHVLLLKAIPIPETYGPVTRMSAQFGKSSVEEQNILEIAYSWSKEREKALRQPQSESAKLKNRLRWKSKSKEEKAEYSEKRRQARLSEPDTVKERRKQRSAESWSKKTKEDWVEINRKKKESYQKTVAARTPERAEELRQQYVDRWTSMPEEKKGLWKERLRQAHLGKKSSEETVQKFRDTWNSKSEEERKVINQKRTVSQKKRWDNLGEEGHNLIGKHISEGRKGLKVVWKEGKRRFVRECQVPELLEQGYVRCKAQSFSVTVSR